MKIFDLMVVLGEKLWRSTWHLNIHTIDVEIFLEQRWTNRPSLETMGGSLDDKTHQNRPKPHSGKEVQRFEVNWCLVMSGSLIEGRPPTLLKLLPKLYRTTQTSLMRLLFTRQLFDLSLNSASLLMTLWKLKSKCWLSEFFSAWHMPLIGIQVNMTPLCHCFCAVISLHWSWSGFY